MFADPLARPDARRHHRHADADSHARAPPAAGGDRVHPRDHAARYLTRHPTREDVLSIFAGIRPLVRADSGGDTASLSRDHTLLVEASGLVTIAGGKWTDLPQDGGGHGDRRAPRSPSWRTWSSVTADLRIHGWQEGVAAADDPWQVYGSDAVKLRQLLTENPAWSNRCIRRSLYCAGEVVWGARHECAERWRMCWPAALRALLLDARASMAVAPRVAELMAQELGQDRSWQEAQVAGF